MAAASEEQWKEDPRLSIMILQLHDIGLITDVQKTELEKFQPNEIKAHIFDALMKTEPKDASKMFLLLRSIEKYGKYNGYNLFHRHVVHPLQTDTVLRHVFGFLGVEDIKTCRLVNKKWKYHAEQFLRNGSKIIFHDGSRSIVKFHEMFPPDLTIPFTSFVFSDCQGPISKFDQFFKLQKSNVKELEIRSLSLMNENKEKVEDYDIGQWISDSLITKLKILPNCYLAVTLDQMNALKYLTLYHGTRINVQQENGNRIAPLQIKLANIVIFRDGKELNEYRINDAIDFSNAEEIDITSFKNFSTLLTFDLAESYNVRKLRLSQAKVINWEFCKYSVETLTLENIIFSNRTEMKIKNFNFIGTLIDLFQLPKTLEKLFLNTPSAGILCTKPIMLPNLNTLILKMDWEYDLKILIYFENCENLTCVTILDENISIEESATLNLDWIPKSVKNITMKNMEKILGQNREIEVLTLDNYTLGLVTKVLAKITPHILILIWNQEYDTNDSIINFLERFPHIKIFIGPLNWNDCEFQKCQLANYVNKMAEYYVFENQKGISIEWCNFKEIVDKFKKYLE